MYLSSFEKLVAKEMILFSLKTICCPVLRFPTESEIVFKDREKLVEK